MTRSAKKKLCTCLYIYPYTHLLDIQDFILQIFLEIRKDEDYTIPIWIIIGSTLGGLQLLALLVLGLWKACYPDSLLYYYISSHTPVASMLGTPYGLCYHGKLTVQLMTTVSVSVALQLVSPPSTLTVNQQGPK